MPQRPIVVIEDEDAIRRGVVDTLKFAGYDPVEAADGEAGLEAARVPGVLLVLLDLQLPKMDGTDVLIHIRRSQPTLPVIILTARGSEDDRIRGLKLGADDYVVKPFSAKELLARVEAVLRRSPDRPHPVQSLSANGRRIDLDRSEVHFADGETVSLSEMETQILQHLATNPGRTITREELLARVWGINDSSLETRAVDMHITRLRNKLAGGDTSGAVEWISTVRGRGYKLGADLKVEHRGGAREVNA